MTRFGSQQWILQVMDAVQNAVQNGIEQLSGSHVSSNEMSLTDGAQYRFMARSREQLLESQHLAADSRVVDREAEAADPAASLAAKPKKEGWLL